MSNTQNRYVIKKTDALRAFCRTTYKRFLGSKEMGVAIWKYLKSIEEEMEYSLFMTNIEKVCHNYFKRIAEVGKCNIKFYRSFKYRCYHLKTKENNNIMYGEKEEN